MTVARNRDACFECDRLNVPVLFQMYPPQKNMKFKNATKGRRLSGKGFLIVCQNSSTTVNIARYFALIGIMKKNRNCISGATAASARNSERLM